MRLIVLFVLLALPGFSQIISQNADTIIINTRLSDSEAYRKLIDLLKQQGWTLNQNEYRNSERVTNPIYKPSTGWLRLVTSVGSGLIRLRGEYSQQTDASKEFYRPVTNSEMDGETSTINFTYLNALALRIKEGIPGASIKYTYSVE